MNKSKLILGAASGNIIEWYEFSLYGFMTPVLARLFFPAASSHLIALSLAYVVLATSFIMRPLGAALYGHFGDILGRKKTLIASVSAMGASSFLMGCLPTYHSIGASATVLLLLLRLLAGLAAGGELGGSVALLVESAPSRQRGLFGSIAIASAMLGVLAAAIVTNVLFYTVSMQHINQFAWRIPFLLSIVTLSISLFYRYHMRESVAFRDIKDTPFISLTPLKDCITQHIAKLIKIMLVVCVPFVINFALLVYYPTYLSTQRYFSPALSLSLSVIGLSIVALSALGAGYFCWHFSRRKALLLLTLASLAGALSITYTLAHGSYLEILMVIVFFSLLQGASFGLQMTYLSELFPINMRYTALSLGYNIGAAVFVSGALIATPYLIHLFSAHYAFMLILGIAALISLLGLLMLQQQQLLFIPGLTFGPELWRKQIEYFRDTMDIKTYVVNYSGMQRNIDKILSIFPRRQINILAHSSIGAGVALAAAAQSNRVKNIVCLPGWVKPNQFTLDFLQDAISKMEHGKYDEFKAQLREVAVGEEYPNRSQLMQEIKQVQDSTPLSTAIRQCQLMLNEMDITALLPKIKGRVLVVRNEENDPWFTQTEADQLAEAVPNGVSLMIENHGHLAPYTSPQKTNTMIELWLND